MRIRAFQGLCPTSGQVEEVACVPYDVINSEEAAQLAKGKPRSLLHVIRPEIDLPAGISLYDDQVYAQAVKAFQDFQKQGVLHREAAPCLYLYRQQMGSHIQRGVATVCHVEDYLNDVIKKHEKTRPDKEDDRTRITHELSANPEPVFLTYKDHAEVDKLAAAIEAGKPLFDFTAPDGIRHTVWRITDTAAWIHCFAEIPVAYVADGHHRSASAARVGLERKAANPRHSGAENYNWFLAVLFPASQLQILPYNRVVKDLHGLDEEKFLERVRTLFQVTEQAPPKPAGPRQVSMYLARRWYGLAWPEASSGDPVSRLDVSVLQDKLLAPLLGIDDPRTSKRIDFVGGIRGTDELVRLVDSGKAAVAFSMYPTTVGQLMAISDAGQIMPPKSTWFEPKLRSGLFIHTF